MSSWFFMDYAALLVVKVRQHSFNNFSINSYKLVFYMTCAIFLQEYRLRN